MDNLTQLIKDSFDVISLILVFAFVLFELRYPQITKEIDKEIPSKERIIERKKHKEKLIAVLITSNIWLVVIYGILFYLFLPLLLKVIMESRISLWQFDFSRTAFGLIILFIFIFWIWSIVLTIKMISRILECNQ